MRPAGPATSPVRPGDNTRVPKRNSSCVVMRRYVGVVVVALATLGCTPSAGNGPDSSGLPDAPSFSGPWADEFESMYRRATSDLAKSILSDEMITDAELAQIRTAFTSCLEDLGFSEVEIGDKGGFSVTPPEGIDDTKGPRLIESCSDSSGESTVGALHEWITRNPENLDESEIIVACLVREGAVGASYTAEQYRADSEAGARSSNPVDLPYLVDATRGDALFVKCNTDPLGILD